MMEFSDQINLCCYRLFNTVSCCWHGMKRRFPAHRRTLLQQFPSKHRFNLFQRCPSALLFSLSALVPSPLVMNVCFVLRKENLPVSSCVPLIQKKDIAVLLCICSFTSVFVLLPDTGCLFLHMLLPDTGCSALLEPAGCASK